MLWQRVYQPRELGEALDLLVRADDSTRIVSGGTDVLVELQRGVKPAHALIDITKIDALRYVRENEREILIGGLATHNDVLASPACIEYALPLVQACAEVGAPAIRTRGTIAGNVMTASPANDTIAPLLALDAQVVLTSRAGTRRVPIGTFFTGFRATVARRDEILSEIVVPKLTARQRGLFMKLGLRRAQAISVIDVACVLRFEGGVVEDARIALGCLAPTVVRAAQAEAFLRGKALDDTVIRGAAALAQADAAPIGDIRGSKAYREATLTVFIEDALRQLASGPVRWPSERPVLLDTGARSSPAPAFDGTIVATVNGTPVRWPDAAHKTLLNAIREDGGLTGAKEGCGEGECGACTVWMDGMAVMSCLVPAVQMHGTSVTTIEGIADGDRLHPLQAAYIERAAVQCGFCIPGMLMAGAKLLEEVDRPTLQEHQTAISGNLCRCTGYRKILDAMIEASAEIGAAKEPLRV